MNRILTFFIAFALVGFFMASCNKPASTDAAPVSNDVKSSGDKIVYIDIDTLISKYDLYVDKKTELEAQSKTAESALAGKIEAFQKRVGKFQQELAQIQQNAANIAPVDLKKMEEKYGQQQQNLAKEEEALMKQRDNAAMDLDKKLQETQKDLQTKIDAYLDKIAEEKGYDFVLMKGAGGSVMFGRKTLDITESTLKQLNDEYAAGKEKK
ncbi:MAG: OmpH family outer membrane protein [Saprospiraceae bacterium]|jgi:outer membrane protein|nr:OmpH family outer membrane protein [Saprospiraceae bacterium]